MKNNKKVHRTYKDSLFVDLFGKCPEARENFLSLYNSMHGTSLTLETTKVTPLMLEQTVYAGRYNDVSMLVDDKIIVLVEQQSTINENMPLRFLEYIVRLYEKLIPLEERYKRKIISLPNPEFYVFYNGTEDYPAEKTLKISDAFPSDTKKGKKSLLELTVNVYNINKQKDIPFVLQNKTLFGYAKFVEYDREAILQGNENHVDFAIKRCMSEGILSDYLARNSTEVRNMLIAEYDYDTDIKVQRKESFEEGALYGIAQQKAKDERIIFAEREKVAQKDALLDLKNAENQRLREEISRLKAKL